MLVSDEAVQWCGFFVGNLSHERHVAVMMYAQGGYDHAGDGRRKANFQADGKRLSYTFWPA